MNRFWDNVNKNGPVHPVHGQCWVWTGYEVKGYGRLGKSNIAHRFSWQLHHGNIPDGLCVLHKCDNTLCVNPKHLFLGTRFDNVFDMVRKGRQNAPRGDNHPAHLYPDRWAKVLTEKDVREMRRLYQKHSMKFGYRALGKRFGVSLQTAYRTISGKAWKHVK